MMYCVEAFESREIWIIYHLRLEECQGSNACSVLQRRKVKIVLTEQDTEMQGKTRESWSMCMLLHLPHMVLGLASSR